MANKKVLILGARGMLGQALGREFSSYQPVCWDKSDLDITDKERVEEKLLQLRPEIIINAAAYTDVDAAETNEDLAILINGLAVGYLAKAAKDIGAVLIHYSTDYVFDGKKKAGYSEDDKPNPINAYGRSKLRGEQELVKNTDKYYLIRSSWLFGPGGKNFVDTILTLAGKQDTIKVVNDQHGKPTYTLDLAKATRGLLESQKPFGIYHITNETPKGGITWYEFARKIVELKGLKIQVVPCKTKDFPRPAQRPEYAELINNQLDPARFLNEALVDYLSQ